MWRHGGLKMLSLSLKTHLVCALRAICAENDAQIAPGLTATAKKLERNLVQNQVSHLLESRPEKDDLVTQHIIEGRRAPPLGWVCAHSD
jgi:hypothetical protein